MDSSFLSSDPEQSNISRVDKDHEKLCQLTKALLEAASNPETSRFQLEEMLSNLEHQLHSHLDYEEQLIVHIDRNTVGLFNQHDKLLAAISQTRVALADRHSASSDLIDNLCTIIKETIEQEALWYKDNHEKASFADLSLQVSDQ